MKYLKLFLDAFARSFAEESGIQIARFTIWAWRGAYFAVGVLIVLRVFGVWK